MTFAEVAAATLGWYLLGTPGYSKAVQHLVFSSKHFDPNPVREVINANAG